MLNEYSWYLKGARDMLLKLQEHGMLNVSSKPLEVNKQYSDIAVNRFINNQMLKQMLQDKHFLDAVLSGVDEYILKWGVDGKHRTLELIPD